MIKLKDLPRILPSPCHFVLSTDEGMARVVSVDFKRIELEPYQSNIPFAKDRQLLSDWLEREVVCISSAVVSKDGFFDERKDAYYLSDGLIVTINKLRTKKKSADQQLDLFENE